MRLQMRRIDHQPGWLAGLAGQFEDVDIVAAKLREMGAFIDRGPMVADWGPPPGYYYFVFEDPDGIRLEVNFVPGAGLLAEPGNPMKPSTDPNWNQNSMNK